MATQNASREFVENWNIAQTLGEGAYGEWVDDSHPFHS